MYAWNGKIIYVDLSKGKIWKEPLSKELRENFIGGRGVNIKLLWELTKPDVDPLSSENVLIFGTGPLTGTIIPMTGRTTITTKSPATNLYVKSSMGGHFAGELKFAGYDHIVFLGRSKEPVYLWIKDETVELRDAENLWGKDVRETDTIIKKDNGDRDIRVAAIGPAGENLVKYAAIMNSIYNAAARGGVGAVMGSKNLKAIAVRGTGKIEVSDTERLSKVTSIVIEGLRERVAHFVYGTSGGIEGLNDIHTMPSFNFQSGYMKDGHLLSGPYFSEFGYLKAKRAQVGCFGCLIGCHLYNVVENGPYTGHAVGPEYETSFSLGFTTGVADPEVVLKANELCNIMGLDTISTGVTIGWAMESVEKGTLTKIDTDGLDLRFGNVEALVKVIPMIAYREGKIGNLLAEGTKRAAEKVGRDSWKWALSNSKGLELSGVDLRIFKTRMLSYSVNPRGPDHLFHEVFPTAERVKQITGKEISKIELEVEGHPQPEVVFEGGFGSLFGLPLDIESQIVRWYEDRFAVTDALGICKFSGDVIHLDAEVMSEMYSLVTGIETSPEQLLFIGRRIYTFERCFNVREGFDRNLDDLPWRIMHEPADWQGMPPNLKGKIASPEIVHEMQDEYYKIHGWDIKTGWPLRDILEKLSLGDVAEELEQMKKLPK
jgi:aldehyde:ferredoxin oxidoreductase